MTTPSQITYCAAHARTDDLVRAAAAARPPVQRGPRSTFRPSTWFGRRPCLGQLPAPHALPSHP
jgi:hypothetical protein